MAKPFTWTFSKLKNYENCPFRYLKCDVQKLFQEDTANLDWGNKVHDAFKVALVNGSRLPEEMDIWQKWVDSVRALPGELLVEQKYGITKDFKPCEYFAPKVWMRNNVDAIKIHNRKAAMFDWKTGKVKHESIQLMLGAACVFTFHPEVDEISTSFVWLPDDELTTDRYTRADINNAWPAVLERVAELEASHEKMHVPAEAWRSLPVLLPCVVMRVLAQG